MKLVNTYMSTIGKKIDMIDKSELVDTDYIRGKLQALHNEMTITPMLHCEYVKLEKKHTQIKVLLNAFYNMNASVRWCFVQAHNLPSEREYYYNVARDRLYNIKEYFKACEL